MDRVERATVLVSGAPGAGKTTVAGPLAAALGFALLSKDDLKQTLHDALSGPAGDLQWSRRIGGAAMQLLWTLAARCPQVVLEAPFRPGSEYERGRLRELAGPLVEVHCRCPPEISARRYAQRAADRHPAHVLTDLSPAQLTEFNGPVGIGPVVDVDTTRPVDIPALAATVRRLLDQALPPEVSAGTRGT